MMKPWFWNMLLAVAVMVAVARFAGYWKQPGPSLPAAPEPPPAASPVRQPQSSALAEEDYGVIVTRNLFSPARSIAPPSPGGEEFDDAVGGPSARAGPAELFPHFSEVLLHCVGHTAVQIKNFQHFRIGIDA